MKLLSSMLSQAWLHCSIGRETNEMPSGEFQESQTFRYFKNSLLSNCSRKMSGEFPNRAL
jgi:hypothetical protein